MKSTKRRTATIIVLAMIIITFVSMASHMTSRSRNLSVEQGKMHAQFESQNISEGLKVEIEKSLEIAKELTSSFESMKKNKTEDREVMNEMMRNLLVDNPNLVGVWTAWETNALDGRDNDHINALGHDITGRFIPYWNRVNGKIALEPRVGYDSKGADGDWYNIPDNIRTEALLEPFEYKLQGQNMVLVSLSVPIFHKNQFVGVVGVDIYPGRLEEIVSATELYEAGYGALVSNLGVFAVHPSKDMIGKKIIDFVDYKEVEGAIRDGESLSFIGKDHYTGVKSLYTFNPVYIGESKAPWTYLTIIPTSEILSKSGKSPIIYVLWSIAIITALAFVIVIFSKAFK